MSDYAGRTFEFVPKSELSPVKIQLLIRQEKNKLFFEIEIM